MRKRICVVTATRAEYGLLKPFILKLKNNEQFDVQVVVTGAHLSPAYGLTYKEIEEDNVVINKKIEILLG
ncbi:UDP-N-acetylglucosamine 2-epimerase (hydrolyzing), partial [Clostridiales bacterium AHG0011]|nr:UDP-N-acetylglucosamine 2-epimerase (hydrolyzing) [Clostridiales bacterium AHG0011]